MEQQQQQYLEDTRCRDISLNEWANLGIKTTAEQLDVLWIGATRGFLLNMGIKGKRVLNRFRHLNRAERMDIWEEALEQNVHVRSLRRLANRQVKAVAEEATDRLEQSVRSKRKMEQGESSKKNRKRTEAVGETSTSQEIDDVATNSSLQETTVSSDSGAGDSGPATYAQPHFDLNSARRITLTMGGFDVGAAFRRLQEEAAPFINDEGLKVSIKELHLMLSANSIWDTSEQLPGMPTDTHRSILSEIKPAVIRLSPKKTRLFLDFSYELAATGRVRSRELEAEDDEDLLQLFQDLSKKLPRIALPSVVDNEDTYSHGALDSLMSFFFPASDPDYYLSWANRPSQGSRERRGERDANKPNCTIVKELFDLAFAEIKAPKDCRSTRLYIQDKWALTSLAKDTIDMHLREGRTITSIFCLQVFGYQLAVYELRFQSGLYMWTEVGAGYLPRDKNDTHSLIRCMELLNTVKSFMHAIPVHQYVHMPPQRKPEYLLPEELRPQPTNISPSCRPFFGSIVKASASRDHGLSI